MVKMSVIVGVSEIFLLNWKFQLEFIEGDTNEKIKLLIFNFFDGKDVDNISRLFENFQLTLLKTDNDNKIKIKIFNFLMGKMSVIIWVYIWYDRRIESLGIFQRALKLFTSSWHCSLCNSYSNIDGLSSLVYSKEQWNYSLFNVTFNLIFFLARKSFNYCSLHTDLPTEWKIVGDICEVSKFFLLN